ncbi:MAG: hypothetical protein IJ774_05545 [Selenomonadaceae bacterium]|nr:hypothetical protein [Selenomonadaceae bacterium]
MSTKVAVVIPAYKDELDELEKISLTQCRKVLSRYPLIFVAPEGKTFSFVEAGDMVVHFPAENFQSVKTYSRLMLSPNFYATFADFDYILIYQLDAFVFYDALEEFCSLGYDYIGAPWPRYARYGSCQPKTPRVGNGGFCLRKVKAFYELLTQLLASPDGKNFLTFYPEDMFISSCAELEEFDFHVAPVEVASLFAMEYYPARQVKHFGLPFGCHYWHKFSADFYVELFARFGYDLQPFRSQMDDEDLVNQRIFFADFALKRLLRAVEHGQSILNYLPTNRFASVQVIRSPYAMKILSRLLTEENSLADEIYIYDETEWTKLLRDLQAENLPHLLIVAYYDVSLVKALERGGLHYGRDFVSFQREYVSRCVQVIRKFGRRNSR